MKQQVILVNDKDERIGTEDKLKAHQEGGRLHRAFSVLVFNSKEELLLQKRALRKYHSGGLWSNTCCSHPRPGEGLEEAAKRRLEEEMGFRCDLEKVFDFLYEAELGELTEKEFDHVLIGRSDKRPDPDPKEVLDWKWVRTKELKEDLEKEPQKYSAWFKICFPKFLDHYSKTPR